MGRILHNWQCTPTTPSSCTSFLIDYTYDYLGNLLSRTDTDAALLHTYSAYTYSYDNAAQLSLMQMTVNASTSNILFDISYNPLGQATAAKLGPAGSYMSLSRAYDNRGQLTYMQNGSVYSIGSSGNPIQYHPDGNVKFLPDSVNGSWTYAYDDFNRLVSAAKSGGATYTFDYDRFGNRWHENVNGSPQSSLTFDNKNHVTNSGYAYDSGGSGNMSNDSFNTFTWDGENRQLQANNGSAVSSYTYDAIGWRVQKTTASGSAQYLFDTAGNVIAEMTGSTLNRAEIYLGGAHLGTYTGGNTYFSHTDLLGTERARTLSTAPGATTQTCTGLPFGDSQSCTGSETSPLHFTGFQRDTETGLDQTWFRKFSSAQGRWLSPDPIAASAGSGDPQSWNRYSYVGNAVTVATDPTGGLGVVQPCCVPTWIWQFMLGGLLDPNPRGEFEDPGRGGGGGGGGGANSCAGPNPPVPCANAGNNGLLAKLKQAYCSTVPNGAVVGLSGSAGSIAGVTGTVEGVRNWDTGETSFFYSGGGTAGLVGLQGNLFGGVVWGLNQGNTNYKAGSTTASASVGPVGGSASFNSPGPKNPSGAINPANWSLPASLTVSLGLSNVPFSGTLSVTSYSDPKLTTATPPPTIVDEVGMLLRLICH